MCQFKFHLVTIQQHSHLFRTVLPAVVFSLSSAVWNFSQRYAVHISLPQPKKNPPFRSFVLLFYLYLCTKWILIIHELKIHSPHTNIFHIQLKTVRGGGNEQRTFSSKKAFLIKLCDRTRSLIDIDRWCTNEMKNSKVIKRRCGRACAQWCALPFITLNMTVQRYIHPLIICMKSINYSNFSFKLNRRSSIKIWHLILCQYFYPRLMFVTCATFHSRFHLQLSFPPLNTNRIIKTKSQ